MTTPSPTFSIDEYDGYSTASNIDAKCVITMVMGCLSILGSIAVVAVYVSRRDVLRRPILDALVCSFCLAIPANVNLVGSAALRLAKVDITKYCSLSGFLFQQFSLPEIMMEGVFFGCMAAALLGYKTSHNVVKRIFVVCVTFGTFSALIPMATLPVFPGTQSIWAAGMPWCWMPDYDTMRSDGHKYATTRLVVFKIIFGYLWASIGIIIGLISLVLLIYKNSKAQVPLPWSIKLKWVYWVMFSLGWGASMVPRFFGDILSDSLDADFQLVLAFVSPGLPFLNSILFLAAEGVIVFLRGGDANVDAYDDMQDKETESTHSSQNLRSPRSPRGGRSHLDSMLFTINDDHNAALLAEQQQRARPRSYTALYTDNDQEWLLVLPHGATAQETKDAEEALKEKVGESQLVRLLDNLPKPPIGAALAGVAGYCDALTFISLGLFSAHVTGNLVLVGVHIASHDGMDVPAIVQKLVALPVFCVVIAVIHAIGPTSKHFHRRIMLVSQAIFFFAGFVVAVLHGPFTVKQQTSWQGYLASMFVIGGMAIQNSYQRAHLVGLPMTAFMTGNTNQIVHDLVDIVRKKHNGDKPETFTAIYVRLRNTSITVGSFFIGGVLAALGLRIWDTWAFAIPPLGVTLIIAFFWQETSMPKK